MIGEVYQPRRPRIRVSLSFSFEIIKRSRTTFINYDMIKSFIEMGLCRADRHYDWSERSLIMTKNELFALSLTMGFKFIAFAKGNISVNQRTDGGRVRPGSNRFAAMNPNAFYTMRGPKLHTLNQTCATRDRSSPTIFRTTVFPALVWRGHESHPDGTHKLG